MKRPIDQAGFRPLPGIQLACKCQIYLMTIVSTFHFHAVRFSQSKKEQLFFVQWIFGSKRPGLFLLSFRCGRYDTLIIPNFVLFF